MAKKDSIDMPVEERLKTLYQLQATLSAIDEKRALRGELPLEVQDLEDEIEGLSTRIEKIQNDINEYERAVTQKKGEIETAKARTTVSMTLCRRRLSIRHWKLSFATRKSKRLPLRLKTKR